MPTLKTQVDWRSTRIGYTPRGLHSDPFLTDAAVSAFDQRTTLHKALDKMFSEKSVAADKAERLHDALDRLLDSEPDFFNRLLGGAESDDDEEPEEENVRKHEASARDRSVAMDHLLDPEENAQVALVDLRRKVDVSRPGTASNSFWHVLWNCAAKLNPVSKVKDLPKSVLDFCLAQISSAS